VLTLRPFAVSARCRYPKHDAFVFTRRFDVSQPLLTPLSPTSLNKCLTLRSCLNVQRGARGSGLPVDPARVREARLAAGLSLARVAGGEVSRTFIHFVETGQARPSKAVLDLIARRTRKPVSYFLRPAAQQISDGEALADELSRAAVRIHRFLGGHRLTKKEVEAMRSVERSLRQGAMLARGMEPRVR
jgi:transcriptional regulator with XRE-family HTH domain